jgi:hypothetical protein
MSKPLLAIALGLLTAVAACDLLVEEATSLSVCCLAISPNPAKVGQTVAVRWEIKAYGRLVDWTISINGVVARSGSGVSSALGKEVVSDSLRAGFLQPFGIGSHEVSVLVQDESGDHARLRGNLEVRF